MITEFDRYGLFAKAVAFAAYAHDGQNRKGTALPYIVHPMEAAAIAATMTNDQEVLAAAMLHDVIEDCGITEREIRVRFGRRVAQLVCAESEEKTEDAAASWQKRKLQTVNRLLVAPREVLILALADKLSNLRAIERDLRAQGPKVWQRFNQTNPSMQHWYYASVCEALTPLAEYDAYKEFQTLIQRTFSPQPTPYPPPEAIRDS